MAPQRTLLYLAREYPFPLNSAARLRTFNWVLHLSKRFQVTLVAPARNTPSAMELEALEGRCHRIVVPCTTAAPSLWRLPQRLWNTVLHAATGIPADARPLVSGPVARAVHQLLREQRFHVAFAERWAQVNLANAAAPYTMLDAGELQTPRQVEAMRQVRNPLQRRLKSHLLTNQTSAEARALGRFHLILLNGGRAEPPPRRNGNTARAGSQRSGAGHRRVARDPGIAVGFGYQALLSSFRQHGSPERCFLYLPEEFQSTGCAISSV